MSVLYFFYNPGAPFHTRLRTLLGQADNMWIGKLFNVLLIFNNTRVDDELSPRIVHSDLVQGDPKVGTVSGGLRCNGIVKKGEER